MEKQDARSLSAEGQEDLRRRVVEAVAKGLSQTEAARVFGVARGTISRVTAWPIRIGDNASMNRANCCWSRSYSDGSSMRRGFVSRMSTGKTSRAGVNTQ